MDYLGTFYSLFPQSPWSPAMIWAIFFQGVETDERKQSAPFPGRRYLLPHSCNGLHWLQGILGIHTSLFEGDHPLGSLKWERENKESIWGFQKLCRRIAFPPVSGDCLSTWKNSIRNEVWRGPTTESSTLSLSPEVTSTHLTSICLNCPCNPPVAELHKLYSCCSPVLHWENSLAGGIGKVSLKEQFTSFSATVARSRRLCL